METIKLLNSEKVDYVFFDHLLQREIKLLNSEKVDYVFFDHLLQRES